MEQFLIIALPVALILGLAIHTRRYVRGVTDFVACGRVCGRYVITVSSLEEGLSVITLVALIQQCMNTGFAFSFWESSYVPLSIFLGLVGFCTYRFRETKALSLGQVLEMRYSRRLRFIASLLRVTAEILTNAIGPAVAARFFVYFLGVSPYVTLGSVTVPTYWLLVVFFVILACIVILAGGQIALIVTDCCQALMSYPIFVILTVYLMANFSWSREILPVMQDRVAGESFLNPYDVQDLRDFNVFLIFVTILQNVLNRANWLFGSGSAAKTAHEGKMGNLLGTWRFGFTNVAILLISVAVLTFMNAPQYAQQACQVRQSLGTSLAQEVISEAEVREAVVAYSQSLEPEIHDFQRSRREPENSFSRRNNPDQHYLDGVKESILEAMVPQGASPEEKIRSQGEAKKTFAKFQSFYSQMLGPAVMGRIFPASLLGLIGLLMFMLMLSTDDSRIFNSAVGIVQDLVIPLCRRVLSPRAHLWCLRGAVLFVGAAFVAGSLFLAQMEYLRMFLMIMAGLWNAGASPIMIGGFYFKFGTTAGAYASLFVGAGSTLGSIFLRNSWANVVYPFLLRHNLVEGTAKVLETLSAPFHPFVVWRMNDVACPINAIEFTLISMILSWTAYLGISLLTYRKPFNLDRLLHRGIYCDDPGKTLESDWSWRTLWKRFLGITPEYTRADRILAWSTFFYGIVYSFGLMFVGVVLWNGLSPWPESWWGNYFWIRQVLVQIAIGCVTTVWFTIGGVTGLWKMFQDLKKRVADPLDNGQVSEGGVSLSDQAQVQQAEQQKQQKA